MSSPVHPEVLHEAAKQRYIYQSGEAVGVLDYELEATRMIFTHTFVPEEFRGQGIAEKLVRAGLAHARQQQLTVDPQCSYVAKFIARHDEFQDLLA
ncbi:MAG: N-acetyltransferase [Cephaloticoccus sp.]|nr:N-acetyltransferase [Cephaloticoccus sp.]MCF7759034.1 N-acetyltransferase [Cephaloticoccus sp.]